ncbi:uncharacterized protein LOC109019072 [Juglans regia]|uniref:Uncharacterized protein LOC109019072 n=1 Tax=Juglans regia TaxID=51240 RepID=A0A6P9EGX9_JUGRE|nr:uncharacterized protein LOC109019072 [Juglans regia]
MDNRPCLSDLPDFQLRKAWQGCHGSFFISPSSSSLPSPLPLRFQTLAGRDRFVKKRVRGPATTDAKKHITGSHVCSSATNVVRNVSVFPREHMGTRKNVHATTTGKLRKVGLSAHDMNLRFH